MSDPLDVANNFDDWAQVAARLRERSASERTAILVALGLNDGWAQHNEAWAKRLNQDIEAGRMELPTRYARICTEELSRRRKLRPDGVTQSNRADDFRVKLTPPAAATEPLPDQLHTLSEEELARVLKAYQQQADERVGGDFRERLTPARLAPQPPQPGQLATQTGADRNALMASARKARLALSWSVEEYARLCIQLGQLAAGDEQARAEVWKKTGISCAEDQQFVVYEWNLRLAADTALKRRWLAFVSSKSDALDPTLTS